MPSRDLLMNSKAWPYVEARKIAERNITGRPVVFECGYGPSGLPHLGTLAEVIRTTWVRHAYENLMGYGRNQNTRLISFSDDMDALRSVPDNVPNQDMLRPYIGVSLSRVPDPYGKYESFAHHNNAILRAFLDRFGFDYEFMSASEQYASGKFDTTLQLFADHYEDVRGIILPTLGPDRRATYSPFMPIDPDTGRVYDTGVVSVNPDGSMIVDHPDYGPTDCMYLGGGAKLQWKADWAMRWVALDVDYEMAGKDLIDSVKLSGAITRALGHTPPVSMIYELFLDAEGKKISKSKGNGLTIDQWLDYGSRDSLSYYLFQAPQKAHTLHPGVVPRAMDDYAESARRLAHQTEDQAAANPVNFIHPGALPDIPVISYSLLLNIASTAAPHDPATLWRYVERYRPGTTPEGSPALNEMVTNVYRYYWDIVANDLQPRFANDKEIVVLRAMIDMLRNIDPAMTEEDIQTQVYEVGKAHYGKENLRSFFAMLYEVLLGQSSGPRFGAFTKMLGVDETIELIERILVVNV